MRLLICLVIFVSLLCLPKTVVSDEYRVQVGDVVRVSLPGEETLDKNFQIDRLGRIYLPEVGALKISGLKERELLPLVKKELATVFQDLSGMNVYVEKRQLLVNVLGYVNRPGKVVLPNDASIQAVIQAAGGIRSGAQLDKIHIRRDQKVIDFNYKKYLDEGDPSLLPSLKSLDVIFVPASSKTGNIEVEFDPAKIADAGDASDKKKAIKVFGEVNSPGSFTFVESMSAIDLLMRAGGVTRYAGVEQVRILNQGEPRLFNLKGYLDTGDKNLLPKIEAGATIFVPRQEEAVKSGANTVYVMGEVFQPGAYESSEEANFMDILANSGGPTRYAESRQIRILRSDGHVIRFDLTAYTEGSGTQTMPKISAGDAIFVPEKTDMNEKSWLKISPDRAVKVIGEVVRPGRIEWSSEMSLLDLMAHVGGPVSRADTTNIEILIPTAGGKSEHVLFNLDEFIASGKSESELPQIKPGTTIRVHDLPQDPSDNKAQWVRQASEKSIYIFGQVGAPGRYMFNDSLNFLDILSAADGPTKDADIHNIRISHRDRGHASVSHLNLSLYFETGDESLLPDVHVGDTIYVPEKDRLWIDQSKETTVRVLGAIHKPGRYRFSDTMTILDILAEAGGPDSGAMLNKILIINVSCCEQRSRKFNLTRFSKRGNIKDLPVLREGDTIFIPDRKDSRSERFKSGLGDLVRVISLGVLLGL